VGTPETLKWTPYRKVMYARLDVALFDATELRIHYAKHHAEFAVATDREYEMLADRFLSGPAHPNLRQCTRRKGDFVRYDIVTQEYGVLSASGVIRSYFKPKPCASIPMGLPKANCHRFPDNLRYFKYTCSQW